MDFHGKRILILGLGESGLSMARHLAPLGAQLRVADTRAEPPGLAALVAELPRVAVRCGALDDVVFGDLDAVAVSPGVAVAGPQTDPAIAAAKARGLPFMGDVELFALALAAEREASGYAPKILAITGTNGKTTVTSLTAFLAGRAGRRAVAAGNIGPAVLDAWAAARAVPVLPEVWVLELSSFQLETTVSLMADAATVLNVTEDHLDRHGSMQEYARAKARIFGNGAQQVLNRDDEGSMAMRRAHVPKNRKDRPPVVITFGTDVPHGADDYGLVREARPGGLTWLAQGGAEPEDAPRRLMPQDVLKIRGAHNAANALAALALNRAIDLPLSPMLKGLTEYAGLPHRVQTVATIADVRYVDDSKGTNVGATLAALTGLGTELADGARIVLIAGGEGKGQDFTPLAAACARHCRAVMLIGRDAPALRAAIAPGGPVLVDCVSLERAVAEAASVARAGDIVLLSPACASFDMFRDYGHRAEVFTAAVRESGREIDAAHAGEATAPTDSNPTPAGGADA
jgi:UDP-N-acetylmuramoylalanine--D-glutamate ligase